MGMTAKSARGLFRATGKAAHPVLIGIDGGDGVYADAIPRDADDFYPTPPEPIRALLSVEGDSLRNFGTVWESAAGDGAMVREIEAVGIHVAASDLVDRGAGAQIKSFYDFGADDAPSRAIVTNPPFCECNSGRWIRHALEICEVEYMALLLPLNWPGAESRSGLWARHQPARVYLMRWRIDFTGKGAPPMLNAWFVWDRSAPCGTQLHMLDRKDGRQEALDL